MARDMSSIRISEAGPDLNDISSNPPLGPEPHFDFLRSAFRLGKFGPSKDLLTKVVVLWELIPPSAGRIQLVPSALLVVNTPYPLYAHDYRRVLGVHVVAALAVASRPL